MADFTYDPGLVIDDETGAPVPNATGELRETVDGDAVDVYDLLGTPLTELTTNDAGVVQRFSADISVGYMSFGATPQFVASDQQQNALTAALAAQEAAEEARDAAQAALAAIEALSLGGLTEAERAILGLFAGLDTLTAEAGWVLTFSPDDEDGDRLILSPVPTPTVSASDLTTGTLSIERLPKGVPVIVSKSEDNYGAADAWPVTRPSSDRDHPIIWEGDQETTDGPGTIMLAGADYRWYTE